MPSPSVIRITELDLNNVPPKSIDDKNGSKIAVIGKPGSGKSFLIRDLMYAKKHIIPVAMGLSGTEDSNGFLSEMLPSSFVHENLDLSALSSFVQRQKIAKYYLADTNPWALVIVDDCMENPNQMRRPLIQSIFKNGRHWKLMLLLGLQYAMDILPAVRICIDGTFIFREPNHKFRKTIWENYASIIPDFKLFCQIMDEITDDHTALYVDNTSKSNKLEDCVFWFRARTIPEDFTFGCDDYWYFHEDRYDEDVGQKRFQ